MALWARRAPGAEAEAAGFGPWGPFSSNRPNGYCLPPEAAAHAERNLSGGPAATARSGASGMDGRGHVAERRDGALGRWDRGRMDRSRA